MRRAAAPLLLALVATAGCRRPEPAPPPGAAPTPTPLPAVSGDWARGVLAGLSLEAKAGQLVGVRADGLYHNPESEASRRLAGWVGALGVGVVVVFDSEVEALPRRVNALQEQAGLPLLVAADMERGMAFRIARGVVPLPYAMAIGAAGSEQGARLSVGPTRGGGVGAELTIGF